MRVGAVWGHRDAGSCEGRGGGGSRSLASHLTQGGARWKTPGLPVRGKIKAAHPTALCVHLPGPVCVCVCVIGARMRGARGLWQAPPACMGWWGLWEPRGRVSALWALGTFVFSLPAE